MARVESTDYRREQGGEFFYDYSIADDALGFVAPPGIRKKTNTTSTTPNAAGSPFTPSFAYPLGMTLPTTLSDHRIIEKTAQFISKTGAQSEIVLKVKQADNHAFFFLNHDHPLNPYYEFLKTSGAIHQEVGPPPPPPPAPVPSQPGGLAALSSYDDSDDDDAAAEPSTAPPTLAPASPAPLPWALDPAPWHVPSVDSSPWTASQPDETAVPWSAPTDEPWHATAPPPAAPLPWETIETNAQAEHKVDIVQAPLVGPPRPWASSAATSDTIPWAKGTPTAWPVPVPTMAPWAGSAVVRPALAAGSVGAPLPIMIPRCPLPLPLPEVKEVIDKLVPFVVKNGPTFAFMVRDKKAHDPLFQFFDPWHQHHAYYQWAIIAERIRQRDSLQAGGAALAAPLTAQHQPHHAVSATQLAPHPSVPTAASTLPSPEDRTRSPDKRTLQRILSRLPRGVVEGRRSRSRSRSRGRRSGDRRKSSSPSPPPTTKKTRSRSTEREERNRKRRSRSADKEKRRKRRKRSRSQEDPTDKSRPPPPPPPPPQTLPLQPVPQSGPGEELDNDDKATKRQRALEALRAKRLQSTAQAAASDEKTGAGQDPAVVEQAQA